MEINPRKKQEEQRDRTKVADFLMFQIVVSFALIGLYKDGTKRILIQPQISETKNQGSLLWHKKISLCLSERYILATTLPIKAFEIFHRSHS
jgi:hypothetical protein